MTDVSQYRLLRTKIGGHVVSFEAAPWENYSTATSTLLHQITNQNYKVGDNNLFCRQRKAVCSCQMFRIGDRSVLEVGAIIVRASGIVQSSNDSFRSAGRE